MSRVGLIFIIIASLVACGRQETKNGPLSPGRTETVAPNFSGSAPTHIGTINGGGGVGIQCGSHVEMLDVLEAKQSGLKLVDIPSSEDEAIQLVSQRVAEHYWNIEAISLDQSISLMSKTWIAPIFKGQPMTNFETKKQEAVEFVDSLPLSTDLGDFKIPEGCNPVQIAYFSDSETHLKIVKSLRDQMDFLSQGILAAHEVIYLTDRRDSIENLKSKDPVHTSKLTREFVGRLFSDDPPVPKSFGVPPKGNVYRCKGGNSEETRTYFYAFQNGETRKLSCVFNRIDGRTHLYQMRADFKDLDINSLLDSGDSQEVAPLKFVGMSKPQAFNVGLKKQSGSNAIFELSYKGSNKKDQRGSSQSISCEKY